MYFADLRQIPWEPKFEWVDSIQKAADYINRPHEDYPERVPNTTEALNVVYFRAIGNSGISYWKTTPLCVLHAMIFDGMSFAGDFRSVNVVVGNHFPPKHQLIKRLMKNLEKVYPTIDSLETLVEWYKDFETIHSFQDGNGRVGGVVIAAYSHALYPEKGWLAPLQ